MSSPTRDLSPPITATADPPASAIAADAADKGSREQSQQAAAQEAADVLARHAHDGQNLTLQTADGECLALPPRAVECLKSVLRALADGHDAEVTRLYAEMTTMEVADFLDMPATSVFELMESGAIPFYKVGRNRRIHRKDAEAYREAYEKELHEVLDILTAEAQALDLYD